MPDNVRCITESNLDVVRAENDPAADCKAEVEEEGAQEKSQNVRSRSLHCSNQNLHPLYQNKHTVHLFQIPQ